MLKNFSNHKSSFAVRKISIELTFMDCTDIDARMSGDRTDVLDFGFAQIRREGNKTVTTVVDSRVIYLVETRISWIELKACIEQNGYRIKQVKNLAGEMVLGNSQRMMSSFYKYVILKHD